MSRHAHLQDRICCDGLCAQGLPCPAVRIAARSQMRGVLRLAPGVIDGPHTAPAPSIKKLILRIAERALR